VSGGRIVKLWLLRQLTEEDKDELLHEPLACFPAAFPKDAVKLAGNAGVRVAGGWVWCLVGSIL
jgi:hypothetical protein